MPAQTCWPPFLLPPATQLLLTEKEENGWRGRGRRRRGGAARASWQPSPRSPREGVGGGWVGLDHEVGGAQKGMRHCGPLAPAEQRGPRVPEPVFGSRTVTPPCPLALPRIGSHQPGPASLLAAAFLLPALSRLGCLGGVVLPPADSVDGQVSCPPPSLQGAPLSTAGPALIGATELLRGPTRRRDLSPARVPGRWTWTVGSLHLYSWGWVRLGPVSLAIAFEWVSTFLLDVTSECFK